MIRRLIILLVAISATITAFAQTSFMDHPSDAKSHALAGADLASGAGALSVVGNFAAAANCSENIAVGASYTKLQPSYLNSQIYQVGGFFKVAGRLAIGAAYRSEILPEQSIINSLGDPSGVFKPYGMAIDLGAAYSLTPQLSLGASGHYILTDIYTMNHQDLGFNISVDYNLKSTSAAIVVSNLGGSDSYISQPQSVAIGGSHNINIAQYHSLKVMGSASYVFAPEAISSPVAAVGIEYSYKSLCFVRGGYRYADPQKYGLRYATIGAGVAFAGYHLDGSYLIGDNPLGGSFMLGLTWRK